MSLEHNQFNSFQSIPTEATLSVSVGRADLHMTRARFEYSFSESIKRAELRSNPAGQARYAEIHADELTGLPLRLHVPSLMIDRTLDPHIGKTARIVLIDLDNRARNVLAHADDSTIEGCFVRPIVISPEEIAMMLDVRNRNIEARNRARFDEG